MIEQSTNAQGERRALLEEKKRWDGGLLNQTISPIVKQKSTKEIQPVASSSISSTTELPTQKQKPVPPPSPWKNHQPQSPSPLSPSAKSRSPRPHIAGKRGKAPKTPLARLVLEKAVRQRERESASASGNGNVFGESSKANVVPERSSGEGKKVDLKASTRLGASVGPGAKRPSMEKAGKAWR